MGFPVIQSRGGQTWVPGCRAPSLSGWCYRTCSLRHDLFASVYVECNIKLLVKIHAGENILKMFTKVIVKVVLGH